MVKLGSDRPNDCGFSAAAMTGRVDASRDAKWSWALVLLITIATLAVAATTTMSQAEQSARIEMNDY